MVEGWGLLSRFGVVDGADNSDRLRSPPDATWRHRSQHEHGTRTNIFLVPDAASQGKRSAIRLVANVPPHPTTLPTIELRNRKSCEDQRQSLPNAHESYVYDEEARAADVVKGC